MAVQPVTLNLPEAVYRQVRRAAEKARRPVNDLLVEAVTAVAPVITAAPDSMRTALAQMAYLNDAALWQAARTTMAPAQRERLAGLHDQQQRGTLTTEEQSDEQALLTLHRETVLVRAQAAVLLKQRGYDVADLDQFEPIE